MLERRQVGRVSIDVEVPILVICFGVRLLISCVLRLPLPSYLRANESENGKR